MKKIRLVILLLLCISLNWSCSDFLDKDPQTSQSRENYYKTIYQLQEALNGTYNILQSDMYSNSEWIFGEACGDDVIGNNEYGTGDISELVNFKFTTSNLWILNRYKINYQGINRANQVIANINNVELSSNDYANYTSVRAILGQAKFLRALFYFNLVKTYGGVPIRPEVEDIKNLVIPRSTSAEVYAYIEKDLREAAVMLDSKYTDAMLGKAGRGSAFALLMKVIMYEASLNENNDDWKKIVELGEYFIDGGNLTYGKLLQFEGDNEAWENLRKRLWFKPAAISLSTDPIEKPTSTLEAISNQYSLDYKSIYGETLNYWQLFTQAGEFYNGSMFEIVFKESGDGTSGDTNQGTGIFQDIYSTRMWLSPSLKTDLEPDPRFEQVVVRHAAATPDGERADAGAENRYLCLKWYTPKKERPQKADDYNKNRRVIRYADVVLIYAEALNECERGSEALVQLNRVKQKANTITSSATLYIAGGYAFMRNQIWKERRLELCHEWDRYFDLVRQRRVGDVLHAFASTSGTGHARGKNFIIGVNELFPIPQNEIDLSNGVVTQNPGY